MRFSRIKGIEQHMSNKPEKELIFLPGGNGEPPAVSEELLPALDDMTPREIVLELDKYIVGQGAAKRAVAVALRNRVRRQKLPPEIAEDVLPKNILMIGRGGLRGWPGARSSKSKPPSTPKWGTWGATSNPWCAIWWRLPSI
jgi:hypothetical protein